MRRLWELLVSAVPNSQSHACTSGICIWKHMSICLCIKMFISA